MQTSRFEFRRLPVGALIIGVLILIIVAACGRRNPDLGAGEEPSARSAVPVQVQTLRTSSLDLMVELSGSTEAIREADMSAELAGTVRSFPHKLGDTLSKGELILSIDPRIYRSGVEQARAGLLSAEASYRQAERELERTRKLKEAGRISDVEFENIELGKLQAESGLHAAQAALEMAEVQLEHAEIRAPFAGRLAYKGTEENEQVAPGLPVASVVDLSGILIRGSVSEADAVRIDEGMTVIVSVPALNDERFEGRVRAVGVRSNPMTRAYDLEIELPNPDERILSGMAARAGVQIDRLENTVAIPQAAIVEQYGEPVAFVLEENLAKRRSLKLGRRVGDLIEVESGLATGDRLIVKGQWSVKDGTNVEIMD